MIPMYYSARTKKEGHLLLIVEASTLEEAADMFYQDFDGSFEDLKDTEIEFTPFSPEDLISDQHDDERNGN